MRVELKKRSGSCGCLLHISSLPSNYGIGTLGQAAQQFVDFLAQQGFEFWQVLPFGMTCFGDSPYQSLSSFAGNPYFVDLDILIQQGLLKKDEVDVDFGSNPSRVDYGKLYQNRFSVLFLAAQRFIKNGGLRSLQYLEFERENAFWLNDFALFLSIKNLNGGAALVDFKQEDLKNRDAKALLQLYEQQELYINSHKVIQHFFYEQWNLLLKYAAQRNIKIMGDIPFYVAGDSADVWANPQYFMLDNFMPLLVAGVPPDYFSKTGQLWGNPVYNWSALEKNNYELWNNRIQHALKCFDFVRIDHFRAFSAYYVVQNGAKDAQNGKWVKGVGLEFFKKLGLVGDMRIIAEDLGVQDAALSDLLNKTGFAGMRVVQFAFSGEQDNMHLKSNYTRPCVVYAGGTHDNPPTLAWYRSLSAQQKAQFIKETGKTRSKSAANCAIEYALSSNAHKVIIPLCDYLGLGSRAIMNRPGTKRNNWVWRLDKMPK